MALAQMVYTITWGIAPFNPPIANVVVQYKPATGRYGPTVYNSPQLISIGTPPSTAYAVTKTDIKNVNLLQNLRFTGPGNIVQLNTAWPRATQHYGWSFTAADPGPNPIQASFNLHLGSPGAFGASTLLFTMNISRGPGPQQQAQAQSQSQNQNQGGGQQNQNQFPGPQQQHAGIGTRIQGRGSTVILRRRFNPKTGRVEVTLNGVISRLGFLNFQVKNLNRRQSLRNYRFR